MTSRGGSVHLVLRGRPLCGRIREIDYLEAEPTCRTCLASLPYYTDSERARLETCVAAESYRGLTAQQWRMLRRLRAAPPSPPAQSSGLSGPALALMWSHRRAAR